MKGIPLFLIAAFMLTSCTRVATGIYGIKAIKPVNDELILKYARKYHIPENSSYNLDTSYFTWLFSPDTAKRRTQVKNHYQPLQALYYDKNGRLQSFQVNCYAGGFPNLEWERDVIVHWSRFMGRQSKRFIRLVQENAKLAGNQKVKIIYVNNDNVFAGAR